MSFLPWLIQLGLRKMSADSVTDWWLSYLQGYLPTLAFPMARCDLWLHLCTGSFVGLFAVPLSAWLSDRQYLGISSLTS